MAFTTAFPWVLMGDNGSQFDPSELLYCWCMIPDYGVSGTSNIVRLVTYRGQELFPVANLGYNIKYHSDYLVFRAENGYYGKAPVIGEEVVMTDENFPAFGTFLDGYNARTLRWSSGEPVHFAWRCGDTHGSFGDWLLTNRLPDEVFTAMTETK